MLAIRPFKVFGGKALKQGGRPIPGGTGRVRSGVYRKSFEPFPGVAVLRTCGGLKEEAK